MSYQNYIDAYKEKLQIRDQYQQYAYKSIFTECRKMKQEIRVLKLYNLDSSIMKPQKIVQQQQQGVYNELIETKNKLMEYEQQYRVQRQQNMELCRDIEKLGTRLKELCKQELRYKIRNRDMKLQINELKIKWELNRNLQEAIQQEIKVYQQSIYNIKEEQQKLEQQLNDKMAEGDMWRQQYKRKEQQIKEQEINVDETRQQILVQIQDIKDKLSVQYNDKIRRISRSSSMLEDFKRDLLMDKSKIKRCQTNIENDQQQEFIEVDDNDICSDDIEFNKQQYDEYIQVSKEEVISLVFNNNGTLVSSSYGDGTFSVIKSYSKEVVYIDRGKSNGYIYTDSRFCRDGNTICVSDNKGKLQYISIQTGSLKKTMKCHQECINSFYLFNNESDIVTASDDRTIKIWDNKTGKMSRQLKSLCICKKLVSYEYGSTIISGHQDRSIRIHTLRSSKQELVYDNIIDARITSMQLASNDYLLLIGQSTGISCEVDLRIGKVVSVYTDSSCYNSQFNYQVCYGHNEQEIIAGSGDAKIYLFNTQTGKVSNTKNNLSGYPVTHCAYSNSASIIGFGDHCGFISILT